MRVRLMVRQDQERDLVKDAEGEVVHLAINPADAPEVQEARATGRPAYLCHLPHGVWVRMDKYTAAPFCDDLEAHDGSLGSAVTQRLVFIEPQTSTAFDFRKCKVTRTGLPLSHGRAHRLGVLRLWLGDGVAEPLHPFGLPCLMGDAGGVAWVDTAVDKPYAGGKVPACTAVDEP